MPDFDLLYNEFERTKDVCGFCTMYSAENSAIKFLLIRSLEKENLQDIIREYSNENTAGNLRELTEKAYNSRVTVQNLIQYIEGRRCLLIQQRTNEVEGLENILATIPIVNCGVRNDNVDEIIKKFVRNKEIKTWDELEKELDKKVLPKIKQYVIWSYYNQTSNDIVELEFLKHNNIIPTMRKIPNIDFFLKLNDVIIPFDLKYTHVSDDYFDLISQGIIRQESPLPDDYSIVDNPNLSEICTIKNFYSTFRRNHPEFGLPTQSKLKKTDFCELLNQTNNDDALRFVQYVQTQHANLVPQNPEELIPLEWWNYKHQGERLFCNNNRLFVFLAYKTKFKDGRELKGKINEIKQKISTLLDRLSADNLHCIHYHYEKNADYAGDYSALSISTIYSE